MRERWTASFYRSLIAGLCLLASACSSKPPEPAITRLAILRFENLTGDAGRNWMGRALSEAVRAELAPVPGVYAIPSQRFHAMQTAYGVREIATPGISSERSLAIAAGAQKIGYGEFSRIGNRMQARLTIEDVAGNRTERVVEATVPEDDVLAAATALAGQISPRAKPYAVRNFEALRIYMQALESGPENAVEELRKAIAADSDYGPPYRLLADLLTRRGDAAGAASVLEAAHAKGSALGEAEALRVDLALATLKGDGDGRDKALTELTRIEPLDPQHWQALNELAMRRGDYSAAVQALRKVVEIEPENESAWNQLGYTSAWAGDEKGALAALGSYRALRPSEANPVDSIGDVHLMYGEFAEAERLYSENAQRFPTFLNGGELYKAAVARLMSGDVAGADKLARRYLDNREAQGDPLVGLRATEWAWLAGHRREACEQLEAKAAYLPPEAASRAYSEAAIWRMMLGQQDAARALVAKAAPSLSAAVARALMDPGVAEQLPPAGGLRQVTKGYALLFRRDFAGAAEALRAFRGTRAFSSDPTPELAWAWASVESGKAEEAAASLRFNPVPDMVGGSFASLYFPRIYYLRGVIAQQQGKTAEARANFELFLKLSGSQPLIWGEEQKAKAAL